MESQELYHKYLPGRHWEDHPTLYAEKFTDFLKSVDFQGSLIDIGCGNGRDVNLFNEKGIQAKGIDYSEKEIALCKEKFPHLGFEVQNAEHLQFKDNSIGAFYMINVIHYVNKENSLNEIFRCLKKGGYLFIHFNIFIKDIHGKKDYSHELPEIMKLISRFNIIKKDIFERTDKKPIEHTHRIIELILQKP